MAYQHQPTTVLTYGERGCGCMVYRLRVSNDTTLRPIRYFDSFPVIRSPHSVTNIIPGELEDSEKPLTYVCLSFFERYSIVLAQKNVTRKERTLRKATVLSDGLISAADI